MMIKGLRVGVLNGPYTNRIGFDTLTLVGEDVAGVFAASNDAPAVQIVPGNLPGTLKAVLVDGADSPAAFLCRGDAGRNWGMASGAYIESSDSRFNAVSGGHPVPLHNRYECE